MLTAASLLLSFAPPQKLATDDPAAQQALFDDFKSRFSKSYATADEEAAACAISRKPALNQPPLRAASESRGQFLARKKTRTESARRPHAVQGRWCFHPR